LSNRVWVVTEDLRFGSDPAWFGRHTAELNATNHALWRSCVWGRNLSGMMDGAGGVGSLLWVKQHTGDALGAHFRGEDGNGNVVALISAPEGGETARYEYGPFGEPMRVTGAVAKENLFRFSTKRLDHATGLVRYEYRVYLPTRGAGSAAIPSRRRALQLWGGDLVVCRARARIAAGTCATIP